MKFIVSPRLGVSRRHDSSRGTVGRCRKANSCEFALPGSWWLWRATADSALGPGYVAVVHLRPPPTSTARRAITEGSLMRSGRCCSLRLSRTSCWTTSGEKDRIALAFGFTSGEICAPADSRRVRELQPTMGSVGCGTMLQLPEPQEVRVLGILFPDPRSPSWVGHASSDGGNERQISTGIEPRVSLALGSRRVTIPRLLIRVTMAVR